MTYTFRGKKYDEFNVGDEYTTANKTVTEGDVSLFAGLSGDYNPLHIDDVFSKKSPFGGRIAHGMLIASIATGQANQLGLFEGTSIALLGMGLKFTGAVKLGDTVYTVLKVVEKKETSKPDRGVVTFEVKTYNQNNDCVVDSHWTVMLKKEVKQ
jgi:acyl dehydratase